MWSLSLSGFVHACGCCFFKWLLYLSAGQINENSRAFCIQACEPGPDGYSFQNLLAVTCLKAAGRTAKFFGHTS